MCVVFFFLHEKSHLGTRDLFTIVRWAARTKYSELSCHQWHIDIFGITEPERGTRCATERGTTKIGIIRTSRVHRCPPASPRVETPNEGRRTNHYGQIHITHPFNNSLSRLSDERVKKPVHLPKQMGFAHCAWSLAPKAQSPQWR